MQTLNKICAKCKEIVAVEGFSKSKGKKDGLNHTCKRCMKVFLKNWRKKNTERLREFNLSTQIKKCWKCVKIKSITEFSKKKCSKDGLNDECKSCLKERIRTPKGRHTALKATAKKTGREVSITPEQHAELLRDNICYYCSNRLQETGSGLDRIDSSKGYTIDNVRPCCLRCNQAKSDMREEEFYSLCESIYKTAKNRDAL